MRYDKKDMAGFGLFAVAAAMIASVFSGPWPLVGVTIAILFLCSGKPQFHVARHCKWQRRR